VLETAEPDVALATLADLTRRFGGNPAFEDGRAGVVGELMLARSTWTEVASQVPPCAVEMPSPVGPRAIAGSDTPTGGITAPIVRRMIESKWALETPDGPLIYTNHVTVLANGERQRVTTYELNGKAIKDSVGEAYVSKHSPGQQIG
jgi:hypothetical protein